MGCGARVVTALKAFGVAVCADSNCGLCAIFRSVFDVDDGMRPLLSTDANASHPLLSRFRLSIRLSLPVPQDVARALL
jgi:hypothetical protein